MFAVDLSVLDTCIHFDPLAHPATDSLFDLLHIGITGIYNNSRSFERSELERNVRDPRAGIIIAPFKIQPTITLFTAISCFADSIDMAFLELKGTSILLWPSSHPADIKVGSPKSEVGNLKSAVRSPKSEVRSPKLEFGSQKSLLGFRS